jgi:hypothetical protein
MPRKRKPFKPPEKPSQAWIVTFSDCMTLLLCFFVMLMTFSSFDPIKFDQMAGAFTSRSHDSVEEEEYRQKEDLLERPDNPRMVEKGNTSPTELPPTPDPPREPLEILDKDLERDKTTFYIPSRQIFWGQNILISRDGKARLDSLLGFFRMLPQGRIIIGESSEGDRDLGMRRAWAILRYFSDQTEFAAARFSITNEVNRGRFAEAYVSITLMRIRIEE